jgi:hypothetical protein
MAYKVACLGVTDSDWRSLGIAALQAMKLDIARKAFIRIRDMKYIELLCVGPLLEDCHWQPNVKCDGFLLPAPPATPWSS